MNYSLSMKRKAYATIALLALLSAATNTANGAAAKAGASCPQAKATQIVGNKKFTCIKSGKKLIWDKGVVVNKPAPTASTTLMPAPIPTSSPTPTAKPSSTTSLKPTPTPTTVNPFEKEIQKAQEIKKQEEALVEESVKKEREKFKTLALTVCGKGVECKVGNTGPGGGVVFYVAKKIQPWGQYLEMAPQNWFVSIGRKLPGVQFDGFGDPATFWCNNSDFDLTRSLTDSDLIKSVGPEIGKGKANTNLMLAGCQSGAANIAASYAGGGSNDWHLPSINELNEMCKFSSGLATGDELDKLGGTFGNSSTCGTREMKGIYTALGDFYRGSLRKYWSSTESSNNRAWCQMFDDLWTSNWEKVNTFYVRPIRSF